uniref:CSON008854 protein n=1 Tax=Culicoides sonorensis TaxID=179676 RepID=A0A336LK15_CULSO
MAPNPIATYEEVKDLSNHPEKYLVDVRGPHELEKTGKIPISINIPIADLETELNLSSDNFREKYGREKPSKTSEIMFHCSKGGRGQKACDAAIAMGFVNARNYKGGWNEWAEKEGLLNE